MGERPRRSEGRRGVHRRLTQASLARAIACGSGDGQPWRCGRSVLDGAAVGAEGSPQRFFDGKIDRPRVLGTDGALVAEWDFSQRIASSTIVDSGPNSFDGEAVNHPTRAVTGHNWTGAEIDFRRAPDEYAAIALHRDDLSDAGWDEDFAWDVPANLPSGLYAARVHCSRGEDHVPFVVRPRAGNPTAEVAVLLPTFTYLAYANERHWWDAPVEEMTGQTLAEILNPEDRWSYANAQLSVYDWHLDGTGTCYSSRNRPITNMRPYYEHPLLRAPHLLGCRHPHPRLAAPQRHPLRRHHRRGRA